MELTTENFSDLELNELESIDGGVAPLLVFAGKAALSGIGFGVGYFGLKKIFG